MKVERLKYHWGNRWYFEIADGRIIGDLIIHAGKIYGFTFGISMKVDSGHFLFFNIGIGFIDLHIWLRKKPTNRYEI